MADSALHDLHTYWLTLHGGEISDDCAVCVDILTIGKATEIQLQNVAPFKTEDVEQEVE